VFVVGKVILGEKVDVVFFAADANLNGLWVPAFDGIKSAIRPLEGTSSDAVPSLMQILHVFICGAIVI